jgi:glycosyltransferase involved in cell wall biosynthesis
MQFHGNFWIIRAIHSDLPGADGSGSMHSYMKLAIYIRTIASAQGTERVTANIARGLADRGHSVDFLVEDSSGWLIGELDAYPNVRVINLAEQPVPAVLHRLFQLRIVLRNLMDSPLALLGIGNSGTLRLLRVMGHNNAPVLALLRYINSEQPASVLSFLNYQNVVLLLVAPYISTDTRLMVNVRNHISTSARHGKSKWMRSVPGLIRRFFPRADCVVGPSRGVVDDVREITGLPADRFRVIVNPVYRPEISELARQQPEHPWLADGDVPVIVAAGKLKPQKDYPTLLEAFARVREQRPVRLIILGRGPLREALTAQAESLGISADIDMPGHMKNPYAFFGNAAVFVLSSAWEGLPNVLIEAMACGSPVVSTDCPSGPIEILDGGRVGRLVPVGDAGAMAAAILATLDSPPEREVVISRAREFSFDRVIADYEALLTGASCGPD